jgi:hypothetical protein
MEPKQGWKAAKFGSMRVSFVLAWLLLIVAFGSGCTTYDRRRLSPSSAEQIEKPQLCSEFKPGNDFRQKILALNAENVTEQDIRGVLSHCPAPRIINIHGGIYPVYLQMISFSDFLIGMGYPAASITNPGDGTYSFSCYANSTKIAGVIAWYYEREGLRPMMVGHSQGGMQVVKVLHDLAGASTNSLHVWNPLTGKEEAACDILDPVTGKRRPVVGLQLPYATAVGAGGLTRLLPNQWDMIAKLRKVPDSVEEFTGFYKGEDLWGGDFLGYGSANHFHAMNKAVVRNVRLPSGYSHVAIPDTRHLLKSQSIKDWINCYTPPDKPISAPRPQIEFDAKSSNILWAADVWHSIKKHWVLELQRLVQAKPSPERDEVARSMDPGSRN